MKKGKEQSLTQFIFDSVKSYKLYLTLLVFVALSWATMNTALPYVLKLIIDKGVASEAHKLSIFSAIIPYIMLYVVLWIGFCLNMRFSDWIKIRFFPSLRQHILNKMFTYLIQHSHQYFQNNFAGSLVNKVVDMQGGVVAILNLCDDVISQCLGLCVAITALLFIHPLFAFILIVWVVLFSLITFVFLKPIDAAAQVFAEARSSLVGKMVDSVGNILNIRLFSRNRHENKYIHEIINDVIEKDRLMLIKIMKMKIIWDLSIIILLGVDLIVLAKMYDQNLVSIGDFSFIIALSISIIQYFGYIAELFLSSSEQVGQCRQALSIINTAHDIVDMNEAKPLVVTHGDIQFKNVYFAYPNEDVLFKNKNIMIHHGNKIGLVGFSGSGKSTFVNLILRLFEVESGQITIDNQNINEVTQASLRENIILIPQDISLFHRSLMENIRYGRSDATDEEVIAASKKAHCHEFISQLREGYASMVGERGIKLSGGQRQRIAIARAILKNAPILILDEATSALDSVTEKYIQKALHRLMRDKTTLVVAHRLSTLSEMDRILVFDKGQIIEDGTHDELLQQEGHYAMMWKMQAGGFLPEFFDHPGEA